MTQRFSASVLALSIAVGVASIANAQPRFDVEAYIESYNLTNIGQAVATIPPNTGFNNGGGTNPNASLGPVAPLPGPISTGTVKGYFDIGCPTVGTGCDTTTYFQANHAYRWGVLDATNPGALSFLANSNGDTAFSSSLGDSGFTAVNFAPGPNFAQRDVQISWKVEDSDPDGIGAGTGVVLQPGRTYVFFAVLADPAEYAAQGGQHFGYADGDPFTDPAGEIYANATDEAPFQFHSGFPVNFFDITDSEIGGTQTATSRLIPIVVPEPASMMLVLGGLALVARRRAA